MYECKSCGGKVIPLKEDNNLGKCESCGFLMSLPTEKNERIINRYNKANKYRMNKEFERAMGVYESILDDDYKEADAYFGIFLCTFGIEYVKDPKTKKDIITCHKINSKNIFDDANYKKALEYSSGSKKNYYETEAEKIDKILRDIIDISKKEKPYDVFICYKESELESDKRTEDSIKSQDLYEELTRSGLRVFFSRISLEKVAGKNYEPYIYGALNTAKVMLVIGSKKEYFESEWMKNEWSRYLKIIEENPFKLLIPVYYDMSPKNLPIDFAKTQGMNMNDITFTQDIIHIVKKVVLEEEKEVKEKSNVDEKALKYSARGYDLLDEQNFVKANELFNKALDEDNTCYKAYLGKILAKENINTLDFFPDFFAKFGNSYLNTFSNINDYKEDELEKYIEDYYGLDYQRYMKYAPKEEKEMFEKEINKLKINAKNYCNGEIILRKNALQKQIEEEKQKQIETKKMMEEQRIKDEEKNKQFELYRKKYLKKEKRNKIIEIISYSFFIIIPLIIFLLFPNVRNVLVSLFETKSKSVGSTYLWILALESIIISSISYIISSLTLKAVADKKNDVVGLISNLVFFCAFIMFISFQRKDLNEATSVVFILTPIFTIFIFNFILRNFSMLIEKSSIYGIIILSVLIFSLFLFPNFHVIKNENLISFATTNNGVEIEYEEFRHKLVIKENNVTKVKYINQKEYEKLNLIIDAIKSYSALEKISETHYRIDYRDSENYMYTSYYVPYEQIETYNNSVNEIINIIKG